MEEKKTESFEEKLKHLEEIVRKLEEPSTPLETSLKIFADGVGLVRECSELLDQATQQVKILTRNADGEVVEADLPPMQS